MCPVKLSILWSSKCYIQKRERLPEGRSLFCLVRRHRQQPGGESPLHARQQEAPAEGKGACRERESEGSRMGIETLQWADSLTWEALNQRFHSITYTALSHFLFFSFLRICFSSESDVFRVAVSLEEISALPSFSRFSTTLETLRSK